MNISYIISIICLAFCFFIFFYFKWYIKRRTSTPELMAEYAAETHRLIAEINSVTDRNLMLVEDRIKKLKDTLEEADKRVSVYARELDRSRTGEALYTSLGRGIRAALKTPVETQPAPAQPPNPPVRQEGELPPETANVKPAPKTPSKRQIRAQIETMVNQGLSPGQIASSLNISLSEVDLAINLMSRR